MTSGGGDGLAVGGVDDGALVAGERADAVAGAEEGEVGRDDAVEQSGELGLDPLLGGGLLLRQGGGVEGGATHEDSGPVVQVDLRQGLGLQAQATERGLIQAGALEECLVLGVGGLVVAAGGQEEEGFHEMTLTGAGSLGSILLPRRSQNHVQAPARRPRRTSSTAARVTPEACLRESCACPRFPPAAGASR